MFNQYFFAPLKYFVILLLIFIVIFFRNSRNYIVPHCSKAIDAGPVRYWVASTNEEEKNTARRIHQADILFSSAYLH